MPSEIFGRRFQPNRVLRDGGDVTTFLGTDVESERPVVIKTAVVDAVPQSTQTGLEHQADVLTGLEHLSIAGVTHVGQQDGHLYVVSPFVGGISLARRLQRGAMAVGEAVACASAIMTALAAAHERGVLHLDLKPSNVMIDEYASPPRATLIDFGFPRNSHLEQRIGELPPAAAHYLSPEQAGLLHRDVDDRSDLFSAGAVLFACLAARPPFEGASVGDVLSQLVVARPPRLRSLRSDVPRALEQVVERLLQPDPNDRYQSAEAVAGDLEQIGRALARGVAEPELVIGTRDRGRRTLTEPVLVGRARELETLEEQLERVRAGGHAFVTLAAESGGGKTRLLEEFDELSAGRHVLTLRGQGLDQSGQAPYEVLEGVVAGIVTRAVAERSFAAVLRERLAGHEAALTAAMPRLGVLFGVRDSSEAGLEEHGELRTMRALRALLDAVGSPQRPALVVLDDCQWADDLTLRLLCEWHGSRDERDPGAQHVLVVCAFRSEEVADDHPLRRLPDAVSIELSPFGPDDVHSLVDSMTGGVPQPVADIVARLSEGSPFMATEILRGLVETGVLRSDAGGWHADLGGLEDAQPSRRAAAFFGRRLERLDAEVLELLSVGAVLGKRFDVGIAGELAGQTGPEALAALTEARSRRIVWLQDDGARAVFVHDKLRETLLERLTETDRAALHLAAALHIEERDPTQVFDIAYHFDAAVQPRRALQYALAAADNARRRHALQLADSQYRIAERGTPAGDARLRAQIAEGLADVAMLRGRYEEAEHHLHVARATATEEMSLARLEGKIGELAFKRGDMPTAREATERALRLLGARVPRRAMTFFAFLLWEVVIQIAHSLSPRRTAGRRAPDDAGSELLAMRLYSRLAHVYWFAAGRVPCAWTHLRGLNRAERYEPTLELAQAYSEHAPVMTMLPWFARGLDYAGRSLAIRRELGDAWGEGQSLHFTGVALYGASRFEDALEALTAAVEILERTGDQWEVNTASWHVALCLYRLGRLSEAVEVAQKVHRAASELGDDQASGIAAGVWGKASAGHAPIEHIAPTGEDVHTRAELLAGQAVVLLARGRPQDAVAALRDADAAVRAKGLRQEYVAPVQPWLATALRAELESTPVLAPARRRQLARQAARAARRGHRLARSYRNNLPHALRERGLLAALAGRRRRAIRLLDRSAAVAEEQSAGYELAQTLLARARLDEALGTPGADAALARAQAAIDVATAGLAADSDARAREDESTLSLADRFSTLLDEGRRIALALTRETALAAAREAAVTLLRAQRCVVVELTGDEPGSRRPVTAPTPADPYDLAAIERALAAESPITIANPAADGEARSAICAPIYVRGEPAACLYATHDSVGAFFGEQEERLGEFICSLAGAALENAEGFAVAERLSRSLERRVEERTAELTASQDEMRTTLSLLGATLESTADGILVVSRDGAIVSHNRKFGEMWGIPHEVLDSGEDERAISFVLNQLLYPEAFVAQVQRLYSLPEAESHDELEFKDGKVYERHSLPQRVDGETIGRVWSFRDVTAQKRIVRELQELDRIKSDFVSTVSHELRTPLTSITGYVEMLRDGDAGAMSEAQDRMLEVVEFNTGRLLAQIEDLLTLSRIEAGTYQLAHEPMALGPIIQAVGEAIMPQAAARELELRIDVADDLPDLPGDARELDRALLNLASNAVKFTPAGGRVTISAQRAGDSVHIAVTDTGVGIPEDEQGQLFTRFFRSSTTTREAIQGTGLGLVIVKGIVDHHGGIIDIDSTPGRGTSVVVRLPIMSSHRAAV